MWYEHARQQHRRRCHHLPDPHSVRTFVCCCLSNQSMILAADVGIGIVGKEGMQASLSADFSVLQFSFILPLLLWHGRNAYKRSARLSQFVIHRGLIISIIQAVFSALFFFAAIPIYNGWLM